MPHRTWSPGEEVLAADFNPNVADQVVAQYANAAARAAAWPAPPAGAMSALTDAAVAGLEQYNAGQWRKPWNLPWGLLGHAFASTPQAINAEVAVTGCSVTVTVPANRLLRLSGIVTMSASASAIYVTAYLKEGATYFNSGLTATPGAGQPATVNPWAVITPTAGAHTYVMTATTGAATGTTSANGASQRPWIAVEDVGPAGVPALRDLLPEPDDELPETEPPDILAGLPPLS